MWRMRVPLGVPLQVKESLNEVAESWTDEEKAHCLDETTKSFQVCI